MKTMYRIKCPKCGSTAQVELVYSDTSSYWSERIDDYECGCGCHFSAIFHLHELKICGDEGEKVK